MPPWSKVHLETIRFGAAGNRVLRDILPVNARTSGVAMINLLNQDSPISKFRCNGW